MTTINLDGHVAGSTHDETTTRKGWPHWVAFAAAGWAFIYGVAALIWTITDKGFPFGANDPDRDASVLRDLSPSVGAPVFAVLLLTAAVVMLAIAGPSAMRPSRLPRTLVLGFGWTLGIALLIVLPDVRMLTLLGYAPILLIGAPFGWPKEVDYSEIFTLAPDQPELRGDRRLLDRCCGADMAAPYGPTVRALRTRRACRHMDHAGVGNAMGTLGGRSRRNRACDVRRNPHRLVLQRPTVGRPRVPS